MLRVMFLIFFTTACSSYRFGQQNNPLAHYGIKSLSIPMFYNFSNFPDVSGDFTRETYRLLTRFSGLKVVSGYSSSSDAVLLGIVRSREKVWDSINPRNLRVAQGKAGAAVGKERQSFYVPGSSEIDLVVQVVVIKKPSDQDIELIKSGFGANQLLNSRVILNQDIPLRGLFNRELLDNSGTQIIGTQNNGVQRRTIENLAVNTALSIRDVILYAY